jgi:hypothetical protein
MGVNPGFNPGFPPFYITNVGGEPRVKPGVCRPEMWALESMVRAEYHTHYEWDPCV